MSNEALGGKRMALWVKRGMESTMGDRSGADSFEQAPPGDGDLERDTGFESSRESEESIATPEVDNLGGDTESGGLAEDVESGGP